MEEKHDLKIIDLSNSVYDISDDISTSCYTDEIKVSLADDSTSYNITESSPVHVEVNADDVAAFILQKLGEMTSIKLQKLVYYCQAWSLVWDEKPLFHDKIEAWANGPVIPSLFYKHKGKYTINYQSFSLGNPNKLSTTQVETINAVLDHYGNRTAQWLIELSHIEEPWINARKGIPDGIRSNREITLEEMAMYYGSLKASTT